MGEVMREVIIASPVTGQRFKAVPNIKQILEAKNSCLGCAFIGAAIKNTSTTCSDIKDKLRLKEDPNFIGCGDRDARPMERQIIWVEVDENGRADCSLRDHREKV